MQSRSYTLQLFNAQLESPVVKCADQIELAPRSWYPSVLWGIVKEDGADPRLY